MKSDRPHELWYVELMFWEDSNMAGYEWSWRIWLVQRKDKTWSIGAQQQVRTGTPFRVRGVYRIRNGQQLKDGIEALFGRDALEGYKPDWAEISARVSETDDTLAAELQQALRADDEPYPQLPETPAQAWIRKASWPPTQIRGAGGLAPAIDSARRHAAVLQFVERYCEMHGVLPTGEHQIDEQMGKVPPGLNTTDGLRLAVYRPGRVKLTVKFPDDLGG